MARKLKEKNKTRLVMTGPTSQPTEMWAEYTVLDGDLAEPPGRLDFDGTDFDAKIGDLWSGAVSSIKAAEKL